MMCLCWKNDNTRLSFWHFINYILSFTLSQCLCELTPELWSIKWTWYSLLQCKWDCPTSFLGHLFLYKYVCSPVFLMHVSGAIRSGMFTYMVTTVNGCGRSPSVSQLVYLRSVWHLDSLDSFVWDWGHVYCIIISKLKGWHNATHWKIQRILIFGINII